MTLGPPHFPNSNALCRAKARKNIGTLALKLSREIKCLNETIDGNRHTRAMRYRNHRGDPNSKLPVLSLFPKQMQNDTQFQNRLQISKVELNFSITSIVWMNLGPLNPNGTSTWKNWWPNRLLASGPPTDLPHAKCMFPKNPDPYRFEPLHWRVQWLLGFEENACWTKHRDSRCLQFSFGIAKRQSLSSLKGLKKRGCDFFLIVTTGNTATSNTFGLYMRCF